jgi:hypothetical protein
MDKETRVSGHKKRKRNTNKPKRRKNKMKAGVKDV